MKPHLTILLAVLALASCGGRGQKKAAESDTPPPGEYHETVTEYENTCNADSLPVKVVEQDYAVVGDIKSPEGIRTYEYEYRTLPDGATERRKFRINNEARLLIAVSVTSPYREETIELNGADTTLHERKLFDGDRRLVSEERHTKMNAAGYGMTVDDFSQTDYEYDALGREAKRTVHRIYSGEESRFAVETAYSGDTDKIVSTVSRNLTGDGAVEAKYRHEYSGDTLVIKEYHADTLRSVEKSVPGYNATISYTDEAVSLDEVYTDGDRRIEVFFTTFTGVFEGFNRDSVYYRNGLKTRWFFDSQEMRTIHIYEYDSRGNPTRERQQAWFSSTL